MSMEKFGVSSVRDEQLVALQKAEDRLKMICHSGEKTAGETEEVARLTLEIAELKESIAEQ